MNCPGRWRDELAGESWNVACQRIRWHSGLCWHFKDRRLFVWWWPT